MKKFNRVLAALLSVCMIFALAACGAAPAAAPTAAPTEAPAANEAPAVDAAPAEETVESLNYPSDTVSIICPYSAGGGTDLIARAMADWFAKKWGVSVIVEDITGGSGAVGMAACKAEPADGYHVILTALAAATLTPVLNDVGYTNEDFAPIAQVTEMVTALCVNSASGITSLEDLFAKAEENPGAITYGTAGATSFQNLLTTRLMSLAGKDGVLSHVPFDGGAAAITATVGQQTDIVVAMVPDLKPYVESGDLTCLMVFSNERSADMPDVPCAGELGYGDAAFPTWYGYAAPAGTPEAILNFWDEQVKECLSDPEMIDILTNINQNPVYLEREAFTKLYNDTWEMNSELIG